MNRKFSVGVKYAVGLVVGGLAGYLYYYFVGCATGTCPISSNPYISTVYCAIIGVLLVTASTPGKKPASEEDKTK